MNERMSKALGRKGKVLSAVQGRPDDQVIFERLQQCRFGDLKQEPTIKSFLLPVLCDGTSLSEGELVHRQTHALRFLYAFNTGLERLTLDDLSTACADVITCVRVCQINGGTRIPAVAKDPFTLAKILYHLITKFTKIGSAHTSEPTQIGECLYQTLINHSLPFLTVETAALADYAHGAYAVLWNCAQVADPSVSVTLATKPTANILDNSELCVFRMKITALRLYLLASGRTLANFARKFSAILTEFIASGKLCRDTTYFAEVGIILKSLVERLGISSISGKHLDGSTIDEATYLCCIECFAAWIRCFTRPSSKTAMSLRDQTILEATWTHHNKIIARLHLTDFKSDQTLHSSNSNLYRFTVDMMETAFVLASNGCVQDGSSSFATRDDLMWSFVDQHVAALEQFTTQLPLGIFSLHAAAIACDLLIENLQWFKDSSTFSMDSTEFNESVVGSSSSAKTSRLSSILLFCDYRTQLMQFQGCTSKSTEELSMREKDDAMVVKSATDLRASCAMARVQKIKVLLAALAHKLPGKENQDLVEDCLRDISALQELVCNCSDETQRSQLMAVLVRVSFTVGGQLYSEKMYASSCRALKVSVFHINNYSQSAGNSSTSNKLTSAKYFRMNTWQVSRCYELLSDCMRVSGSFVEATDVVIQGVVALLGCSTDFLMSILKQWMRVVGDVQSLHPDKFRVRTLASGVKELLSRCRRDFDTMSFLELELSHVRSARVSLPTYHLLVLDEFCRELTSAGGHGEEIVITPGSRNTCRRYQLFLEMAHILYSHPECIVSSLSCLSTLLRGIDRERIPRELCCVVIRELQTIMITMSKSVSGVVCDENGGTACVRDVFAQAFLSSYMLQAPESFDDIIYPTNVRKPSTSPSKLPAGSVSSEEDADNDDVFSDSGKVSWDADPLQYVDRSLMLWEDVFIRDEVDGTRWNDVIDILATMNYLEVLLSIYKLAQSPNIHRATALMHHALSASTGCTLPRWSSALGRRFQLLTAREALRVQLALGNIPIAEQLIVDTDCRIASWHDDMPPLNTGTCKSRASGSGSGKSVGRTDAFVKQCGRIYLEYLIAKAETYLIGSRKVTRAVDVISEIRAIKSMYVYPRSKDEFLVDGSLHLLEALVSAAGGHGRLAEIGSREDRWELGETELELVVKGVRAIAGIFRVMFGGGENRGSSNSCGTSVMEKWFVLDSLLIALRVTADCYSRVGDAREAKMYYLQGIRLSEALHLTKWFASFNLSLARLWIDADQLNDCDALLHSVHSALSFLSNPTPSSTTPASALKTGRLPIGHAATTAAVRTSRILTVQSPNIIIPPRSRAIPEEKGDEDVIPDTPPQDDIFVLKSRPLNLDLQTVTDRELGSSPMPGHRRGTPGVVVVIPESWSHNNGCECRQCIDLVLRRLWVQYLLVKASVLVRRKNYTEADQMIDVITTNLHTLIKHAGYTMTFLGRLASFEQVQTTAFCSPVNRIPETKGKQSRKKPSKFCSNDENETSKMKYAGYNELLLDLRLLSCEIALYVAAANDERGSSVFVQRSTVARRLMFGEDDGKIITYDGVQHSRFLYMTAVASSRFIWPPLDASHVMFSLPPVQDITEAVGRLNLGKADVNTPPRSAVVTASAPAADGKVHKKSNNEKSKGAKINRMTINENNELSIESRQAVVSETKGIVNMNVKVTTRPPAARAVKKTVIADSKVPAVSTEEASAAAIGPTKRTARKATASTSSTSSSPVVNKSVPAAPVKPLVPAGRRGVQSKTKDGFNPVTVGGDADSIVTELPRMSITAVCALGANAGKAGCHYVAGEQERNDVFNSAGCGNAGMAISCSSSCASPSLGVGIIDDLVTAFNRLRFGPPSILYRRVCHALAAHAYLSQDEWKTAYYLSEAHSITLRHNCIINSSRKLRKLDESSSSSPAVCNASDYKQRLINVRNAMMFGTTEEQFKNLVTALPIDMTVIKLSVISVVGQHASRLYATRFVHGADPITIPLIGYHTPKGQDLLGVFSSIMQESQNSMILTEKSAWWKRRMALDERLEELVDNIDSIWLGCWRGTLLGTLMNASDAARLKECASELLDLFHINSTVSNLQRAECLLNGINSQSSKREISSALQQLLLSSSSSFSSNTSSQRVTSTLVEEVTKIRKKCNLSSCTRSDVVLVLDRSVQHLPWESLPVLVGRSVTRIPSLLFLRAHLDCLLTDSTSVLARGIDKHNVYYVLNPDDNLPSTQQTFETSFEREGWKGVVGRAPSTEDMTEALTQRDLFVYCGHGTGSKYFSGENLQLLQCRAAVLLIGCSSGKLTVNGDLEASGLMLNYFLSGSACVLANLWDVTDRDIDRFLAELLRVWMREDSASSSSNSSSSSTTSEDCSLLDCIPAGRKAIKLKYLIGAAPVVYGFPVVMKNNL